MVTHDERWRPASEIPECDNGIGCRVIVEYAMGWTGEAWYWATPDHREGIGFFNTDHSPISVTRWRYWPEPPTPEQEERRRLEERVLAYGAKCLLGHPHTDGATEEIRAILREWAAKPV
jgi:hypothetical protein